MWVRSYFAGDAYPLLIKGTTGQVVPGEFLRVESWSGRILIELLRLSPPPPRVGIYRLDVRIGNSGMPRNNELRRSKLIRQAQLDGTGMPGMGFGITLPVEGLRTAYGLWWYRLPMRPSVMWHILSIPYWLPWMLLTLTPPVLWLKDRRRRRSTSGSPCPHCGYDLRASPGRCPECGHLPAAA